MTKIKLCGLSRPQDIDAANELRPDYIGFVFAPKSRRYVTPEKAEELKRRLRPGILAVGVFVDAPAAFAAELAERGVVDAIQLHGREDGDYIRALRGLTGKCVLQAFRVRNGDDLAAAEGSAADVILLDSGAGTGKTFDWALLGGVGRPFFLAGGLDPANVGDAVRTVKPWGVDVSSGIETDGAKDEEKMAAFIAAVRKAEHHDES